MTQKIKVMLLSSAESTHTARWANALSSKGIDVLLISQHELKHKIAPEVTFVKLKYNGGLGYFLNTSEVKRIARKFKPDFIHAHFASGYGTLAKNTGMPYILSVWGSDVYDFPQQFLKKLLLKRVLSGADKIFSTSHCMKLQTQKFTKKEIIVIPFGVNINNFYPKANSTDDFFHLGIVKVIDQKYGIDILLKALAILNKTTSSAIKLTIIGDGPQMSKMKNLAEELSIQQIVDFKGWVPNDELPKFINSFDVFVVPSRLDSESFGVAAVEAGACGKPCVVSNVGGLPEVVNNMETGIVVPKEDPDALADAIKYFINNNEARKLMGLKARDNVVSKYDWDKNVETMISYYK